MLVSLDIETACGVGCEGKCDHALDEHRNRITVIGCFYEQDGKPVAATFRCLDAFRRYLDALGDYGLVGHNLKFDLKTLTAKGLNLADKWSDDTLLMAATLTKKIPTQWLEWYETERQRINATLPRGFSHRTGNIHSLKCLAPYFLGVAPFWETPDNHDNDEYVLRDCEYTFQLARVLAEALRAEGSYDFYRSRLLPWTRMLLEMERRGVSLDLEALELADSDARYAAAEAKRKLDELWAHAHATYFEQQVLKLRREYDEKAAVAASKLKDPTPEKQARTFARYQALFEKAREKVPTKLNLDSPAQLTWLLKEYLGLDISDFHGEDTTGKPVLQRLSSSREDVKVFLEYRKQSKLVSAFFPSYREMHHKGVLHTTFNPTGTRTGRLSSSGPNLQQVPSHLHRLFRARPGYKLATYDMSAIEPRLIAFYTHDVNLYDIVASGADFHGNNARIFFGLDCELKEVKEKYPNERKMAKEVGLSLFYGAGAGRLQETSQKYGFHWGMRQCQEVLKRFKEEYEGVYRFREEVINPVLLEGGAVTNLLGRQFRIDDPNDVHLQGLNSLIQGSASDLVINSAARITAALQGRGISGSVLLLVHDEIITEVPEFSVDECIGIIHDAMTKYDLVTPLGPIPLLIEGKVADTWEK